MKIALDAQPLFEKEKTGIGWMVQELVTQLLKDGENEYQLNYFAFRNKEKRKEELRKYLTPSASLRSCGSMPFGIYRRIWNALPLPYSMFMGGEADVTQFFNFYIPPGVKGKKVVFIYDMVWKACPETMEAANRQFLDRQMRGACERADAILTISEFSRGEIIKYMGAAEEKVKVVPCGVNAERFHPRYRPEIAADAARRYGIDGEYVLYLGTLEPRKNLARLIEAYHMLRDRHKKEKLPRLVLAGKKGWLYEDLFPMVESFHLEKEVIFTGYVEDAHVPLLLRGACAFVFPSLYEGFGLPPLEAMSCGTPVITSNVSSLPEVAGGAGLLVDPYSAEEICGAMETLVYDNTTRSELARKGLERAGSYTWEGSARKLRNIWAEIAGGQGF